VFSQTLGAIFAEPLAVTAGVDTAPEAVFITSAVPLAVTAAIEGVPEATSPAETAAAPLAVIAAIVTAAAAVLITLATPEAVTSGDAVGPVDVIGNVAVPDAVTAGIDGVPDAVFPKEISSTTVFVPSS
jgi:hypothetical protein